MKKHILLTAAFAFGLTACSSSMNDAMTPDPKYVVSDFDQSIEISQATVSAAEAFGEDWTTLGFFWTDRAPNFVLIEAGIHGIDNISSIAFNIDGEIIEVTQASTAFTNFETNAFANISWSKRGFLVAYDDFKRIATASTVKFKVVSLDNTYGVSTFGQKHPDAIVSGKLPKFLALTEKTRAKKL